MALFPCPDGSQKGSPIDQSASHLIHLVEMGGPNSLLQSGGAGLHAHTALKLHPDLRIQLGAPAGDCRLGLRQSCSPILLVAGWGVSPCFPPILPYKELLAFHLPAPDHVRHLSGPSDPHIPTASWTQGTANPLPLSRFCADSPGADHPRSCLGGAAGALGCQGAPTAPFPPPSSPRTMSCRSRLTVAASLVAMQV